MDIRLKAGIDSNVLKVLCNSYDEYYCKIIGMGKDVKDYRK